MRRTFLWFRNDLRIHDNPIVAEAINAAKKGEQVVPVYFFDPRFTSSRNVLDQRHHARLVGDPKMSGYRAKFLMECVNDLRASLRSLGSDLLVFYDKPETVLPGGLLYCLRTEKAETLRSRISDYFACSRGFESCTCPYSFPAWSGTNGAE
jgi:deoxyribodipyrimidine photolyase